MTIRYSVEPNLTTDEFSEILYRSTLAERRPIDRPDILSQMLANADIILTARNESGNLVGVSRAISDFSFCTYLSDLAVDKAYQKKGIGKELIARTHRTAGLHTRLILLSAPAAQSYYPHIGMEPHSSCWQIPPVVPPMPDK